MELTTVSLEVLPTKVKELDSVSNKLINPSLSSEVVLSTLAGGLVLFAVFLT